MQVLDNKREGGERTEVGEHEECLLWGVVAGGLSGLSLKALKFEEVDGVLRLGQIEKKSVCSRSLRCTVGHSGAALCCSSTCWIKRVIIRRSRSESVISLSGLYRPKSGSFLRYRVEILGCVLSGWWVSEVNKTK